MNHEALEKVIEQEFAGHRENILNEARRNVSEIDEQAAATIDRLLAESRQRREQRAKNQCDVILNRAKAEADRSATRTRGAFVDSVIEQVGTALDEAAGNGSAAPQMERFVREALDAFVASARDEGLDVQQVRVTACVSPDLEATARREAKDLGLKIKTNVDPDADPGITVADESGRVRVINSLRSRLSRKHDTIIERIAETFRSS